MTINHARRPQTTKGTDFAYSARGVSKAFPAPAGTVIALDRVDLDIVDGSFTCIVGPSGCGKSTLLRILGGLESPTVGDVTGPAPQSAVPASAFVFQEHGVFPWFTIRENVAFGLHMAGTSRRERDATASRWLEYVGLTDFAESYPHQLSGGMKQRTAIARAFATGSPSLLMDEPLGALDAQTRRIMQEQLIDLWERERKTVVLVTHSIEEALILGDRILLMSARPGQVKDDIHVPFEHPRSVSLESLPEFIRMKKDIWESLREEVQKSVTN